MRYIPWDALHKRLRELGITSRCEYSIASVEYVPTHPVPPWPLSHQEEIRVIEAMRMVSSGVCSCTASIHQGEPCGKTLGVDASGKCSWCRAGHPY